MHEEAETREDRDMRRQRQEKTDPKGGKHREDRRMRRLRQEKTETWGGRDKRRQTQKEANTEKGDEREAKVTGPYKKGPKFQPIEGIAEIGVGLGATILKTKKEWTLINGLAPSGSLVMFFSLLPLPMQREPELRSGPTQCQEQWVTIYDRRKKF
jgi:hypothetical protein